MDELERFKIVKNFAIQKMLDLNKEDLKELGVKHDVFFPSRHYTIMVK